jgi:NADH-quinone oxidoreductase subunit H
MAVFMAGWSSNNKYALLGSMRTIAMLISYEIIQVLALLGAVLFTGSMQLGVIVDWQVDHVWLIALQPIAVVAYIISGAVEMNRSPMDIAEAESEIVAGYHTEYGGIKFGFFYQAEYLAGFAITAVIVTLYLGGYTLFGLEEWIPGWLIFLGKLYTFFFIFIWFRGTLPRLRIDQLMAFAWKYLLPIVLINVVLVGGEMTLWQEADLSSNVAIPLFVVINLAYAVLAVVGWAYLLGHTSSERTAHRAILTREVGSIHYGEAAPNA